MRLSRKFRPDWSEQAPKPGTYRSIAKYGDPHHFKHPSDAWVRMMQEEFGMSDADFSVKQHEGHETVTLGRPVALKDGQVEALEAMVGKENVASDDFSRVRYSSGKTTEEIWELRRGIVREVCDVVVHPRDKHDVQKIVEYCDAERIPVTVFSGGSSCNFGCRPMRGGVTLVLSTHMNQLLEVNELDQTARVQPGMFGPAYEEALNRRGYTCGHFPQSFEYSTVGGWVVTLGSGQASTYYGDAYDIVFSQEYVTPAGTFKTLDYPATATGPKVNDIMKGSEGTFGILVEVTMRVFRYTPENRRRFSFMFPTWEKAVDASRQIMQGEFGLPAIYRISDPEETDRGLKLYGMPSFLEPFLAAPGLHAHAALPVPGQRRRRQGLHPPGGAQDTAHRPGPRRHAPGRLRRPASGSTPATPSRTCARTSTTSASSPTRWRPASPGTACTGCTKECAPTSRASPAPSA